MDASKFDKTIATARKPEDRVAWFGALISKESRSDVEIVGGSAIEIYLSSAEYVSQDVDLVGRRDRISPVLRRWRFEQLEARSRRVYWFKESIGLVDIVGAGDRSGLPPRRVETPHGPVLISAVEPLIVRRLSRAYREQNHDLYRQARELAKLGELDWEYLETMTRYEGVYPSLKRLRKDLRE